MGILGKLSFKDQTFRLREDAILDAATRILAGKGFDLMTMDDVAGEVGISNPSSTSISSPRTIWWAPP
jgi:AcrR family transcriptional regulator